MKYTINFGFLIMCLVLLIFPGGVVYAFFPTFDITETANTISTYTTQVQNVSASVQSSLSVDKIKQSIGDSVGSISKFTNLEEKKEKLQKKLEKQQKRAKRLSELRQKWENTQADVQDAIDSGKETYKDAKQAVEDTYSAGQGLYEQGQGLYEQGKDLYENEIKDQSSSANNDYTGSDFQNNYGSSANYNNVQSPTEQSVSTNGGSAFGTDVLPTTQNFQVPPSENGQSVGLVNSQAVSDGGADKNRATVSSEIADTTASARKEFYPASATVADAKAVPPAENSPVSSAPVGTVVQENLTDNFLAVRATGAATQEVSPQPSAKANNEAVGLQQLPTVKQSDIKRQPFRKSVISDQTSQSEALTQSSDIATVTAVSSDSKSPNTETKVKSSSSTSSEVKSIGDKTSFNDVFSSTNRYTLAFAQMQESFKTGTNNDGKFIYSDIIATKCGMNFDEVSEEKVAECVKVWVLGMNDNNAETATDWQNLYKKALHDHVAADVNKSLEQKNYSANFETKIADDLENKSEALTNEREEVSFSGQVNQVNQEIIIRLMEAQTSQVVTEALTAVTTLEKDYYGEEDE